MQKVLSGASPDEKEEIAEETKNNNPDQINVV
jgi:hypothetical protein